MFMLAQQIILFLGTLIGAITDTKTGYIYDWITIPMIILGIVLSLTQTHLFNITSGTIIFVLLLIGYKLGKIGGGDVKLFTGIALLNPTNQIGFLLTLFFVASVSAIIFSSTYYSIKYFRKGIKIEREKTRIRQATIILLVFATYFFVATNLGIINPQTIILLAPPLCVGLVYYALQEGIREEFFEKKVLTKNLGDDEIIGKKNSKKIKNILGEKVLIGEKEKELLKKHGIKSVYILENLPKFGPFIFIGTIIAIMNPNLLFLLV